MSLLAFDSARKAAPLAVLGCAALSAVAGNGLSGELGWVLWLIGAAAAASACATRTSEGATEERLLWLAISFAAALQGVSRSFDLAAPHASLWLTAGLFLYFARSGGVSLDPLSLRFNSWALSIVGFCAFVRLSDAVRESPAAQSPLAQGAIGVMLAGVTGILLARSKRGQGDHRVRSTLALLGLVTITNAALAAVEPDSGATMIVAGAQFLTWAALTVAAQDRDPRPPGPRVRFRSSSHAPALLATIAAGVLITIRLLAPAPNALALQLLDAGILLAVMALLWHRVVGSNRASQARLKQMGVESSRVRSMLNNINDAVFAEDRAGQPMFVNQRFYRMFGMRPEDLDGRRLCDFLHDDDRDALQRQFQTCLEKREPVTGVEYRAVRGGEFSFPVECSVSAVESGGIPIGVQAVFRDVSRERIIEKSEKAMAQRLEFFFSEMPLGCIIWTLDFAVQEWNDSAEKIFGWTHGEALAQRYADFLAVEPEDKVERAWKTLENGRPTSHQQCRNRTKAGATLDCEWFHTSLVDEHGKVVGVASMVQDITQRRDLERQLLQAQKMEAVGTLAGGIAHDFNNLLTTILGNVTVARMQLGPSNSASRRLADAETAADRASELTQQLLRFGRKSPAEMEPVDLRARLREIVDLIGYGLDPRIQFKSDIAENLWLTEADAGQIGQVVMNLCVNARDALEQGGTIRLSAVNRTVDSEFCKSRTWARPGDYVEITVSDNGPGIDDEIRTRIFEPFFTTKPVGKGSGLGLATAYGIIKNHGGGLELQSSAGEGAVFQVYLRRVAAVLNEGAADEPVVINAGAETVLVADDDPNIRRLASEILRSHGRRVLEAADGQEAVDQFGANPDQVDLVILDLTMPRKSGREAFEEIRRIRPNQRVIISSGYSSDGVPPGTDFLPKPYKARQLLEAVQSTLEQPAALV